MHDWLSSLANIWLAPSKRFANTFFGVIIHDLFWLLCYIHIETKGKQVKKAARNPVTSSSESKEKIIKKKNKRQSSESEKKVVKKEK